MGIPKPFHRNYRKIFDGPNSGYSSWIYVTDRDYSVKPEHYARAFMIIQDDIKKLFEYIEPADGNLPTYSYRIHELLMRTCIEVEANFRAILRENTFSPIDNKGAPRGESDWNMNDYRKVNVTHHLDDYKARFPFWTGVASTWKPFQYWKNNGALTWYKAYNESKHNRLNNFERANLSNLLEAFAGLFILLSAQFGTYDFLPGGQALGTNHGDYHDGEFGIGEYLMVEFPTDWTDVECYDFNWTDLSKESDRFERFNYNTI